MNAFHGGHIREPMLNETIDLLHDFYRPYDELLAAFRAQTDQLNKARETRSEGTIRVEVPLERRSVESSTDAQGSPDGDTDGDVVEGGEEVHTPDTYPDFFSDYRDQHHPHRTHTHTQPLLFNTTGLTPHTGPMLDWLAPKIRHLKRYSLSATTAEMKVHFAQLLCLTSLSMDVTALHYLLVNLTVPATLENAQDYDRNALHCLGASYLLTDASSKSGIFMILRQHEHIGDNLDKNTVDFGAGYSTSTTTEDTEHEHEHVERDKPALKHHPSRHRREDPQRNWLLPLLAPSLDVERNANGTLLQAEIVGEKLNHTNITTTTGSVKEYKALLLTSESAVPAQVHSAMSANLLYRLSRRMVQVCVLCKIDVLRSMCIMCFDAVMFN